MKTRTDLRSVAGLLAAGCVAAHPLPEVPIVGGSPEERAVVEAELAWFAEQIAPARIELVEVRFADVGERILGHYTTGGDIALRPDLQLDRLAVVLRHELCHALDFQTDLAAEPHPALDAYGDRLHDPEYSAQPWKPDPRDRRSEAVASICEVGPAIAAGLAVSCPGEAPVLSEVAAFARDRIWGGGPHAVPVDPPVLLQQEVIPAFDQFALLATTTPGVLWLVTDAAVDRSHAIDLYTGERLGSVVELDLPTPVPAEVELEPALEMAMPLTTNDAGDRALVEAAFDVAAFGYDHHLEYPRERLLYTGPDVDGWAGVPMCLPPDAERTMFTAEGEVWYAELDGQQLWWSPVRGHL